jgi:selenocysteine lyase/cysteine desulfurase
VNPIEEIGAVTRKAGVMFMVDACQSVGQLELDVERIGCDVLSATSRKYLRGPRGCGLLYVRRRLVERLTPPFLDLHAAEWVSPARYEIRNDARRFENWESNVAGVLGMGAAIDYALSWGLPAIERRVTRLAEFLRARLERIPGVTLRDLGKKKCGIVSFTVGDRDPVEVRDALASRGINVWCSPASGTLLDMTQRKLTSVVRASVHYYNDDAEIDRFTAAIECVVR